MADTTAVELTEPKKVVEADKPEVEGKKYTLMQAIGLNTMMMFGTGPFISIPLCLAAVQPAGPQALVGYSIAALGCLCDSLVWGELGSRFPKSGGSYVYLRECFGRDSWGKLASFIYTWQFWVSAPAEVASGFIAISEYLVYIHGDEREWVASLIAEALLFGSIAFLCLGNGEIGKFVYVLWAITIAAIIFVLVGGLANWNSDHFQLPPHPFGDASVAGTAGVAIMSLGAACRFGVYDFTGYYDVCQMGGEVEKPKRTIPLSCIATCAAVLVVYELTYISVIAYLPWYDSVGGQCVGGVCGDTCSEVALANGTCSQGFVSTSEELGAFIMATFAEKMVSRAFGIFFAIIVAITIFGSVFSMLSGMIYLPGAAAEDGMFFKIFAQRSNNSCSKDRPLVSLITIGLLSACWCWFSLDTVIDAMTSMLVLVQFLGQCAGLCVLRYRISKGDVPDDPDAWKVKGLFLVAPIQMLIFLFIYCTTDNWIFSGNDPILDLSIVFIAVGFAVFFGWQKVKGEWPFDKGATKEIEVKAEATSATTDDKA